jgi:hypothetical protein
VNKTFDGWLLSVSELQGVVEYKHGQRQVLLEARAVPGPPTAVTQTADGTIWIGTAEKGLFQFRPEKFIQGTAKENPVFEYQMEKYVDQLEKYIVEHCQPVPSTLHKEQTNEVKKNE